MAKKLMFGGELDEPLPPLILGILMSEEEKKKAVDERSQLELHKLDLLSDHFGVVRRCLTSAPLGQTELI